MLFNGTFLTLIGVMSPPPPPLCNTYLSGCLFLSLSMCIPIPHPISSPGTWIRTCLIQLNAVVLKVGGRGLLLFQYLFFICPTVRIFFLFFDQRQKPLLQIQVTSFEERVVNVPLFIFISDLATKCYKPISTVSRAEILLWLFITHCPN